MNSVTCEDKHHCTWHHRTRLRAFLPGDWRGRCGSPVTAGRRGRTGQGDVALGRAERVFAQQPRCCPAPAVTTASSWQHRSRSDQPDSTRGVAWWLRVTALLQWLLTASGVRIPVAPPGSAPTSPPASAKPWPCLWAPLSSLHFSGFSLNVTT